MMLDIQAHVDLFAVSLYLAGLSLALIAFLYQLNFKLKIIITELRVLLLKYLEQLSVSNDVRVSSNGRGEMSVYGLVEAEMVPQIFRRVMDEQIGG